MENLSNILETTLSGVNASVFARKYYSKPHSLIEEYEGSIIRVGFNETHGLGDRKKDFVNARKEHDGLMIIGYEQMPGVSLVNYDDSNHAMKKLLLLPLFRERSKADAIKFKATPEKKFRSSLELARLEDRFVGYDFIGLSDGKVRTVSFIDALEGSVIADNLNYVELDSNDYNNHQHSFVDGGKINARVRSSSGDKKYSFRIDNVPMRKQGSSAEPEMYAKWFDIFSNHDCEKVNYGGLSFSRPVKNLKYNSFSTRHVKGEMKMCQHIIAAVKKYNRIRDATQVVFDPFIEFGEAAQTYYIVLCSKTLMEVPEGDAVKLKPLNEVNKNLLMYDFIRLNPGSVYFRK